MRDDIPGIRVLGNPVNESVALIVRPDAWCPCQEFRGFDDGFHDFIVEPNKSKSKEIFDEPLKEAIELAYLIGQRPCDLRGISETDIRDGVIHIKQDKTSAKLRVEVSGALAALISRIRARKAGISGVKSLSLTCNEKGEPLGKYALRYRFDKARNNAAQAAPEMAKRLLSIQFRDLRAKAASDVENLERAQKLLGHTKRDMTEHYIRARRGDSVKPVQPKNCRTKPVL
ncbi:MAG: tyrosine-type recombinase/integrase [Zoogloeaceae bacterium]|jgi:integrase|nr:tyrosine-type recombinase/integrase [Zoogloeaceae bacterium]